MAVERGGFAFVCLLHDRDDAIGLSRLLEDVRLPNAEAEAAFLVPPIAGLAFFADQTRQDELDDWWGENVPAASLPVYLVNHEDGLPEWMQGVDGLLYVGVPSPAVAALYGTSRLVTTFKSTSPLDFATVVMRDFSRAGEHTAVLFDEGEALRMAALSADFPMNVEEGGGFAPDEPTFDPAPLAAPAPAPPYGAAAAFAPAPVEPRALPASTPVSSANPFDLLATPGGAVGPQDPFASGQPAGQNAADRPANPFAPFPPQAAPPPAPPRPAAPDPYATPPNPFAPVADPYGQPQAPADPASAPAWNPAAHGGAPPNPFTPAPGDPYGAPQGDPFGGYGQPTEPFPGQPGQADPFGAQPRVPDPFSAQPPPGDPYGAPGQRVSDPFGAQPPPGEPYGGQPAYGQAPYGQPLPAVPDPFTAAAYGNGAAGAAPASPFDDPRLAPPGRTPGTGAHPQYGPPPTEPRQRKPKGRGFSLPVSLGWPSRKQQFVETPIRDFSKVLMDRGPTIVVMGSRKGGVGKTSYAAGVAIVAGTVLDTVGHKAAIVDANIANPDAWGQLNLREGAATVRDVVAALTGNREPPPPVHATTPALACYPESRETSEYSKTDIKRFADYLRRRYTFIVVDMSNRLPDPLAGPEAAVAAYWLEYADVLVLPTTSSKQDFNGVLDYLDVRDLPPTVVPYIVPTVKKNREHPVTQQYLQVIKDRVHRIVEIPDEADSVRYAGMEGVPVEQVSPALRSAYRELTEVIARVPPRPRV